MSTLASALTGLEGERVALCEVSVAAVLQDLLAEVTILQTYRNDEKTDIEAVYTFPLPLDAVLLDLGVEIGGRVLKGVVVEKKAAEESYEDAVDAGDAAVMLESLEPGLYTMNVGNLPPQQTAKITFRYAIVHRWAGDRLRFLLPTTIAPRYGESPHQPHQVPEASLTVENAFSLRVDVFGALRDAQFDCPSHTVDLVRSNEKLSLSLTRRKVAMDRDFVLNVKAPRATRSFVLCGQDGDGVAALASFQPFFPGLRKPRPLTLAIVIDCSGSMDGDSIEQAKQALEGILERLQPHDRATLIAFGSSTSVLANRPLPCNKANLVKARRFAASLNADMGGTEIGNALRAARSALGSQPSDILVVTDGEVSDWQSVVGEARTSGHRIFTVGVGSAVSEAFVRELADATGGECELVSPREGMAERVVRHFERMRAPRAKRVAVRWPDGAANTSPARIGSVFDGDTVVACAFFDPPPAGGGVILEIETEEGEVVRQEVPLPATANAASPDGGSTVARVAATMRLDELDEASGLALALRYRLVSPWTNWLVVAPGSDEGNARDLPPVRKVPQTFAAGSHGAGSVVALRSMDAVAFDRISRPASLDLASMPDDDWMPELAGLGLLGALLERISDGPSRLRVESALELLTETGLATEFEDVFRRASELGLDVRIVAAIVLARLLEGPLADYLPDETRAAAALLRKHAREVSEAFRELGDRSAALAGLLSKPVVRDAVRQPPDDEAFDRLARIPELLDHLDRRVREWIRNVSQVLERAIE